jgi:predicted DsbA family dithiol-disulfide isomerase
MRIEVWADLVCPWCWLGWARLKKALLAAHDGEDELEVLFRSFELEPRAPKDMNIPTVELLAQKFGLNRAQIDAAHARLTTMGRADGIEFRFERTRTSNTFESHQLVHLARTHAKETATIDRLFSANFHDGVRIGERAELIRLGTELGLDEAEIVASFDSQQFGPAVRSDEVQASELGISGVPFYVFEGELGVSGAQSVDVLLSALSQASKRKRASR